MKKIWIACAFFTFASLGHAADPLHGTVWKTIDENTHKAKALVKFTEQKNGTLSATIQQVLTPGEENACSKCQGPYHNKSLKGLTIVHGLKPIKGNMYDGGTIIDPNSGKSYKLKATFKGQTLDMRGYVGVSILGRNQIWQRVN